MSYLYNATIKWHDDNFIEECVVKIGSLEVEEDDDSIFYYFENIEEAEAAKNAVVGDFKLLNYSKINL
jgi:hypothetical protein